MCSTGRLDMTCYSFQNLNFLATSELRCVFTSDSKNSENGSQRNSSYRQLTVPTREWFVSPYLFLPVSFHFWRLSLRNMSAISALWFSIFKGYKLQRRDCNRYRSWRVPHAVLTGEGVKRELAILAATRRAGTDCNYVDDLLLFFY